MATVEAGAELPFWAPSAGGNAWDRVVIDGVLFGGDAEPGTAKITGSLEAEVKSKRSRGRHGSRLIDSGIKPAEIKITFRCWTADQFNAMRDLIQHKFQPWVSLAERRPIQIDHPALAVCAITLLKCKTVHLPTYTKAGDEMTVEVDFVQYTPASKRRSGVTVTQIASIPPGRIDLAQHTTLTPPATQSAPDAPRGSEAGPNAPPS